MSQVGRISGPLLTANLERNGIDLAFRNNLSTTQLLYLDVNNGRIGVNTDSPARELDIVGKTKTTDLLSTTASLANLNVENNNINTLSGNIFLNATNSIRLSNFETDNIRISDNSISSFNSNSNIDLQPNGTGTTEIYANLNITGNLHSTGNITANGNITFGNADTDDVTFNADVNSNLIPDQNNTYSLGTSTKRWGTLYSVFLNGTSITTEEVSVGDDSLATRQGNIFYVSENGDDTNVGDHPQGPFKTIKHALSVADASTQGPVTIHIFAGGYEEELPLVVPVNVNIIGEDMRNTFIRPASADQSKDVFHLNGETTIQNLTVTDFYYDSINDTGYAFRFAPNTTISTRSPYIQNCSVITKGTTTTPDDPRGFASGDAGKGALVDGADVTSISQEASMLFHSVTFITPGVDGLTMTNGVRVEWLNSFTYFANRGLYAVDGVTGHLSTDGSTVKYGAEIRSIGSANVYGNYGAVADGADCLMYLIQHNFAYIGAGKYVDNDPSRAIQTQEVLELNSGRIFYQSIDHLGNFRVGNQFFVDQELGETSLTLTEGDIDALNGLTITTNGNTTYVDGERIDVGNFRLSENLIETLAGDFNISSASNTIRFQNNTNIQKNLSMTGNLSIGGSLITLGNQTTDTVAFNTEFSQNLEPDISGIYNLGSQSRKWINVWLSEAQVSDIKFKDNFITTTESNADLELVANGTGKLYIENNNVEIDNNLDIDTLTDIQNLNVNGSIVNLGNRNINLTSVGIFDGNFTLSEKLNIGSFAQFENIKIQGNRLLTTESNSNLSIEASSSGLIYFSDNNLLFQQSLSVNDILVSNLNLPTKILDVDDIIASTQIRVFDNVITTTLSNSNLELRANGTGVKQLENVYVLDNKIYTELQDLNLNLNDNINITGTKSIQLPKGNIAQRTLTTSHVRFNTETALFEGLGNSGIINFGGVYSSDRKTNVLADKTNNFISLNVNNLKIGEVNSGGIEIHGLQIDDILLNNNTIITNVSNSNLELERNGIGRVVIDNIEISSSQIYNTSTNSSLTISHTANGYAKVTGTLAVVIPKGTEAERTATPQIGETRWNTDSNVLETYDGTEWIVSAGGGETVTADFMEDLSNEWSLILG